MALDHALAETLGPGQAVLRLYEWAEPTVSLGRNEPALARWGRVALPRIRSLWPHSYGAPRVVVRCFTVAS